MKSPHTVNPCEAVHGVSFREATRAFVSIGLNSFGGPTGQIAVMHRVLVEERKWISEERFLHALNLCMLLPGPEAMQLVTYCGWLLHRTRGGLVAGLLFILPGFLSILILSMLYTGAGHLLPIQGIFHGLRAAVLAIVIDAVFRVGKRVLKTPAMDLIACASFVSLFIFDVPFPIVIAWAAGLGWVGGTLRPSWFSLPRGPESTQPTAASYRSDLMTEDNMPHTRPSGVRALRVLLLWLPLWLLPSLVLRAVLGPRNVFSAQAWFFSKAAAVTFGGAYSVLAYVAQQAVEVYGWLTPAEMLTGLGLAETTPGPLIMVLQFVGYMGAYHHSGELSPVVAGVFASLLAAWTTFTPCFLWIFLCAPYMESLRGRRTLTATLSCITAAVVGVILNLGVWFAVRTLFHSTQTFQLRGIDLTLPRWSTVDIPAVALAALAAVLLLVFRVGVLRTLLVCGALGLGWSLVA